MIQPLNDHYSFAIGKKMELLGKKAEVSLPHPALSLPHHYYSEGDYQGVFSYGLAFDDEHPELPVKILHLEGAMLKVHCYFNDADLGEEISGYLPVDFDLTGLVKKKGNRLLLIIDSREDKQIPPFGNVVDYLTYAGIYRPVSLLSHKENYLSDIFVKANANGMINIEAYDEKGAKTEDIDCQLYLDDNLIAEWKGMQNTIEKIKTYTLDEPTLYTLKLTYNGEEYIRTLGFRDAEWKKDGFCLNGKKTKLIGLNRHQTYPYFGAAASASLQADDAHLFKQLGINVIRTSHYPQSEAFLAECDKLGLLVIDEIPGWQHIGGEQWKKTLLDFTVRMIKKERNHPCLIAYGLRIDESRDDHDLYTQIEAIQKELDPSRASIGVRNFKGSEQLEDIYGYNDFSCSSLKHGLDNPKTYGDQNKARLVTENNGHMFPTKASDRPKRQVEQALRHLKVIDDAFKHKDLAGAVAWCAFDYGTHQDFGSGDHICYHGIMTIFRNLKPAAYAYMSQFSKNNVAYIPYHLDLGDYSATNIPSPFPIFTNADYVTLYHGEEKIGDFYPDKQRFPHLPHPPIYIDNWISDTHLPASFKGRIRKSIKKAFTYAATHGLANLKLRHKLLMFYVMKRYRLSFPEIADIYTQSVGIWGNEKKPYRFDFIKGGNIVKTIFKGPALYTSLDIQVSKKELVNGETYDSARIEIRKVDNYGNLCQYGNDVLKIKTTGPIRLLSPATVALEGGMISIYVASKQKEAGEASLQIEDEGKEYSVGLNVR